MKTQNTVFRNLDLVNVILHNHCLNEAVFSGGELYKVLFNNFHLHNYSAVSVDKSSINLLYSNCNEVCVNAIKY